MIEITRLNHCLVLEIKRPEKKNALVVSMYRAMAEALESVEDFDDRAVLIKGTNNCFTAGNDIADFVANSDNKDVNESHRFMLALSQCKVPVVAQVQGLAIGIGTTLLLHCDFVYCDENAKFAMPFINLGLVPEYASSYILPRIAGNLKAAELLMLGETFDAKTALDCAIVSSVVNADELDALVQATIAKLVAKPKKALEQTKALLKHDHKLVEEHIVTELNVFAKAMTSEPAKEAFAAFLEKRAVNTNIYK
ncbi:enoyl-CoA hydratase/isomerase family protein [Glaciecola sp. MH2013]|uniref:enoyl-CoA hydratase-related protein n=1 Tax=Glaciecola sp. MH2013 TaxID=2785524 RepID=UPI0018A09BF8|nr:enoyl-CoA hydratase-related protein [Glaciecola sp. MH2013]MBF7072767.1 enoyl-CoA hydratase/isomerase family protein [Glaciecola sp. MH2013]